MSIWVKIWKYHDFGKTCPKISILVKIFENIDFGQNSVKKTPKNLVKFV